MSTFGFQINGTIHLSYYPFSNSELGDNLIEQITKQYKRDSLKRWKNLLEECDVVKISFPRIITEESYELSKYDAIVKKPQKYPDVDIILKSRLLLDHVDEEKQPLFEHNTYIVNFDGNTYDVYLYEQLINCFKFEDLCSIRKEIKKINKIKDTL